MKATCPHCGTYGPVESFLTDDDAKRAVVAVGKLPGELPRLVWAYLGLHRKPGAGRALTWERVGRIVAELARLVAEAEIQWKGKRVVPNRPEFWAQGVQAMLDRDAQGKLERPLDGHNYLRAVVYEIAEKAWHQGNVAREKEARHRTPPVGAHITSPRHRANPDEYQPIPMSEGIKDWRVRLGLGTNEDSQ